MRTLRGNTFIKILKGTKVETDDPAFPEVILAEDVIVCSNACAMFREPPVKETEATP